MFSAGELDGDLKDTPRNVIEHEEFVFNLVTKDIGEQMDRTSAELDADHSEFDFAGLQRAESEKVTVPKVTEAPVALEYILYKSYHAYDNIVVLGEVVYAHVDDTRPVHRPSVHVANLPRLRTHWDPARTGGVPLHE